MLILLLNHVDIVVQLNPTQPTFCFPNHLIMTQGNTCTYINGLTNNHKQWRFYFEFWLKHILTLNKKIKTKQKTYTRNIGEGSK